MSGVQHVTCVDGMRIGYATSGTGPPLVMVHGATADHTALSRVIPFLEPDYTVHAIKRRGRGLSGDTRRRTTSPSSTPMSRAWSTGWPPKTSGAV
jgi:pimeloyl-ACP methyl ester carboxylesterase